MFIVHVGYNLVKYIARCSRPSIPHRDDLYLLATVENWLNEHTPGYEKYVIYPTGAPSYCVEFPDGADAILFKLTWC